MHTTSNSSATSAAALVRGTAPQTSGDPVRGGRVRTQRWAADERLTATDAGSLQRVVRAVLQRAVVERAAGKTPTLGRIRLDLPQDDGTRIRLVVAQTTADVGIVAVCAPAHRPRLERCLAQMREKLALAGISLHCKVHER